MATATVTKTSLEKKHLGIWYIFCGHCFFLASFIVDSARCKWTGRSTVEVNLGNKRFTIVCFYVVKTLNLEFSRCHLADYVKELY